ncbi:MAG: hypothetical protein R6W90_09185 [Ignavibacteriaceae bacterium]
MSSIQIIELSVIAHDISNSNCHGNIAFIITVLSGGVINGSATNSLRKYNTSLNGNILRVFFS